MCTMNKTSIAAMRPHWTTIISCISQGFIHKTLLLCLLRPGQCTGLQIQGWVKTEALSLPSKSSQCSARTRGLVCYHPFPPLYKSGHPGAAGRQTAARGSGSLSSTQGKWTACQRMRSWEAAGGRPGELERSDLQAIRSHQQVVS